MSRRALLIAALALMAGGLLLGGLGVVLGGGVPEPRQEIGQPGEQGGPAGAFGPRRPGFVPATRPGAGIPTLVPSPSASPAP